MFKRKRKTEPSTNQVTWHTSLLPAMCAYATFPDPTIHITNRVTPNVGLPHSSRTFRHASSQRVGSPSKNCFSQTRFTGKLRKMEKTEKGKAYVQEVYKYRERNTEDSFFSLSLFSSNQTLAFVDRQRWEKITLRCLFRSLYWAHVFVSCVKKLGF